MPPPPNTRPLTAAQRDLAGDPAHVRVAKILAERAARHMPRHRHGIFSAAFLGLVEAARSFDPDCGVKFTAFLAIRVRGAIKDCLRAEELLGYRRETLWNRGREAPGVVPLGWKPGGVSRDDFADTTPGDCDPDPHPLDACRHLTRSLPANFRVVLHLYYGFAGMTMKRVARLMGLSESRVSQIHADAIEMLREDLAGRYVDRRQKLGDRRGETDENRVEQDALRGQ